MKKFLIALMFCTGFGCLHVHAQLIKKIKDKIKNATTDQVVNDAGNATNTTVNQTDNNSLNSISSNGKDTPTIQSYQNYDFVPGDTILFADDFSEDLDGEFPAHWTLSAGQAVINKVGGVPSFLFTQGNYCHVYPRMKTSSYLGNTFTIEFDYFANDGYGPGISFSYKSTDGDYMTEGYIIYNTSGVVSTFDLPADFSASYPNEDAATFRNKWHHCAFIYKNGQGKCYIDQYRILVIPDFKVAPVSFGFAGMGDQNTPIIIANVRAASGGNMNLIGKKFTESKIVTHGITFDVDKSDIKPESMGTLNMIVGVLKSNPDLKFEIDGHTDNTGEAAHNLTLSQQRADAVKTQLVKMGIDASRLTTKGFGDTKPISDNDSAAGKANNRRVEFVRL
ncbi:MAG: OmpA family protein [Bacteroidetes bacterium]|nr:OmpA family protein [Bacteroidota bacterium]